MTSTLEPLPNPERDWERGEHVRSVERDEVARRLGRPVERFEVLSGGLANLSVRVDGDLVMRVYRRDRDTMHKEAALLRRGWRSLRVPEIVDIGDDFLLLEHVAHGPVQGSARHGDAVGRALGEIHAVVFARSGLLDGSLEVVEPFDDFVASLRAHAAEQIAAAASLPAELGRRVLGLLDADADVLRAAVGDPVLLHGDFKASNLHWTDDDQLLVLDWEFAYAGSALMDVGQLMRWSPPTAFRDAFAAAYVAEGRHLPADWQRSAATLDLVNLVGLLRGAPSGSRRASDILRRIADTLEPHR